MNTTEVAEIIRSSDADTAAGRIVAMNREELEAQRRQMDSDRAEAVNQALQNYSRTEEAIRRPEIRR